jgi:hypothetical protein
MPECWRPIALCVAPQRSPRKDCISVSEYQNSSAITSALETYRIHIQADSHILYSYVISSFNKE